MNKKNIFWITFVAINGGLLFGLNMAGIAGAVDSLKVYFKLDDLALGIAVSSIFLNLVTLILQH